MPPYRFTKTIFSDHSAKLIDLLRQARLDAGLTQVSAAAMLGCRQTFLSKIECGERRLDVVELVVICQAYGVSAGDLLNTFVVTSGLGGTGKGNRVKRKTK